MISKLRHWWQEARVSFWFVPAVIVLIAVVLAAILIALDAHTHLYVVQRWPLLLGAGAAGSRGLLAAVASSMITVAGVVFSITIVALSLTSSQYTSRVLRNFMGDRINQIVLGVFVGIFAYCLVVLRTIRAGDEGGFVPSLAVLAGVILAFVGIAFLIFFIHHITTSIQASSIIAVAAHETILAVDRVFPAEMGDAVEDGAPDMAELSAKHSWLTVEAPKTGYVENVDAEALLAWARKHATIVRMEFGIGDFVVESMPLFSVTKPAKMDEESTAELTAIVQIGRQRTIHQDAAFGIRQIVDIALKALSPGINDSTTAVICVDHLGAILVRLASRPEVPSLRMDQGVLRVIARGPTFDTLLDEAFDQIRQSAAGNIAILTRMLHAMESIAGKTVSTRRMQSLRLHTGMIAELAREAVRFSHDGSAMEASLARLSQRFDMNGAPNEHNRINQPSL